MASDDEGMMPNDKDTEEREKRAFRLALKEVGADDATIEAALLEVGPNIDEGNWEK
jgi:hypothetical protein